MVKTEFKILFVCLGNICRSPLAEGIFRKLISEKDLITFYKIDSCGTGNYHIGQYPDPRTIRNADQNGVILDHRCRQIQIEDLKIFDLVVAMDESNKKNIFKLDGAAEFRTKVRLMREFDDQPAYLDVPDPYHGNAGDFQEVFEILERCVKRLLEYLEAQRTEKGIY